MLNTISVNLHPSYDIYIDHDLLGAGYPYEFIKKMSKSCIVIADENVAEMYGKKIVQRLTDVGVKSHGLIVIDAGENNKNRKTKEWIEDQLLEKRCGRDIVIIAVGGGVTTDMVGFVASTYNRGVPVIYFPTTLLAMIDASVGGKTGVNTKHGKNLIGAFYQPRAVFMDVSTLRTLPQDEFKIAFVEILVHALIMDSELFNVLLNQWQAILLRDHVMLKQIIIRNCEIKASVVESDEHDAALRNILNFGHTVAHAVENCMHYAISHGKAVAIGIIVEAYIAMRMKYIDHEKYEMIVSCVKQFDLSLTIDAIDKDVFMKAMRLDKKSIAGIPHFVLLRDIGKVYSKDGRYAFEIPDDIFNDAYNFFAEMFILEDCHG